MYGSVTVAVRGMTKTESANTLLMWQMVTMAVCHSFLLLFGFKWPTVGDAAMMALGGVANAAAQYAWTQALLLAPASAVSPFYYLMLVWAMVIGFVVWGDVPTAALAGRLRDRGRVRAVPAVARDASERRLTRISAAITLRSTASFVHWRSARAPCSIGTGGENR